MFIRTAHVLIPLVATGALVAFPHAGAAQDAAAVLTAIEQGMGTDVPRRVRVAVAGSGYKSAGDTATHYRIEPHTMEISGASTDALWTPIAFLAGAASGKATQAKETRAGTPYTVISFTANGQVVRGYVTEKNVLERIRTETKGEAGGAQVEEVFLNWEEFDGLRFPSLIIQKQNDRVSRILVVSDVGRLEAGP